MLKLFGITAIAVTLVGCAAPASHQGMTVASSDVSPLKSEKLNQQVYVRNVTGGRDTNPAWISQVDSQSFRTALEASLSSLGYRSTSPDAKFRVDANLQDLHQPGFGLTFNVQSTVGYTVTTESGSNNLPVTAVGTATISDAFIGAERMKIANERSIKENIKAFIARLTKQFGN